MSAAAYEDGPKVVPLKVRKTPPTRALIVLGVAVVLAIGGVTWLRAPKATVTTENAYLKSDRTVVAPRVKGLIAQVLVADNQAVVAGQPLIVLDPEEYAARLAAAQGDVAITSAAMASAQGALSRLGAEEALAASNVAEAQTGIRAADAQSARAQADWKRYESLVDNGTVARRDAERVRADAVSASAVAEHSRAAYAVSRSQATVTGSRRGEALAALESAKAAHAKALAALSLAQQDANHAVIRAPIAGIVGDRQANPGDYVAPGTRLLTLVPMDTLYVTANFKETQVERMLRGQAATLRVDALPGVTFKAHVDSFAPGSGSEFALLPFEPGSGNFTKIVQRVPVRLKLDPGQPDVTKLRPGLSAKVTVRLKE